VLLVARDPAFAGHDPGRGHPERPERLAAVERGIEGAAELVDIAPLTVRPATRAELERVHPAAHLDRLMALSAGGGGRIDADTSVSAGSWAAAERAAGSGLAAVDALGRGEGSAAFCAVRPPGHHACPNVAMGFCLINNVAVTAAALAERGERVLIVDWDAHHGNGTQDAFYPDPRVLYVSFHEWPLYPGTGRLGDMGTGTGTGATCNVPLPAGATGDLYLRSLDDVVAPIAEPFAPTWVLVSAGFDAHRADPLTGLGLSAGDFALLAARVREFAPEDGRVIAFLEGGYDLDALAASVAAALPALAGAESAPTERATAGGPGTDVVVAAQQVWADRVR
jgi:acetoin utilization deacetylase AcuC-like enzyme